MEGTMRDRAFVDAGLADELRGLAADIHAHPELAFEEHHSIAAIGDFLASRGHALTTGLGGLTTAFEARVGPASPSIAILAEYDALPEIGHACGHNLIAMTTVGAFVAAAAVGGWDAIGLRLIGTPAEESGGGKILMLDAGVFEGVVAAISSHPASESVWAAGATNLAFAGREVVFDGVEAHAASAPGLGRNALSGLLLAFAGVDAARQRLAADDRIAGIITEGGVAVNVIPGRAVGRFGIRSATTAGVRELCQLFEDVVEGAARQTQTGVTISETMRLRLPMTPAAWVSEVLQRQLDAAGLPSVRGHRVAASSDLGNVSAALPTDWLRFPVSDGAIAGHSVAMAQASSSELGYGSAIIATELLAATLLELPHERPFSSA
jgi:amidohydrolase